MSKCNVCGLIHHWTKQYPDLYENKTKPKYESQITLLGECMDTIIGETLSMGQLLTQDAPKPCVARYGLIATYNL